MPEALMQARDAFLRDTPERREVIAGRDWGVIDTGAGTDTMLFLPGTLGRADIFFAQIAALAPHRRVIAVSYPASGGVHDWAGDIATLLAAHGIAQVAVLGSSLGGFLAQYLAATHPGLVSHLFAANTLASVAGVERMMPYALDLWTAPIADLRAGFAAGLNGWAQAHPDQRDVVDLLLAEAAGRIPEAEMRARLDAIKRGPELPSVTVPATIIESADDPLISLPMREAVRARLPGAMLFHFDHGGHFPYLGRASLYTALLMHRLGLSAMPEGWRAEGAGFAA